MARGSTLHGKWGNGAPGQSVTRTGFVENTITEPKAQPIYDVAAPKLKYYSEPWYTREPFDPEFGKVEARGEANFRGQR
jgi:hypothetical protein